MTTLVRQKLADPWRAHPGSRAAILIDSRDYYRAFYETARRAQRSILLLGWQFDSDVHLVRGEDVPPGVAPDSVRLLPFLEALCVERPELEIRLLAWDHSVVFAMEREILQKLWFNLMTGSRFHFELDSTVPEYGAHHQKVAVIDGQIAFLGSSDICQDRWDTSEHTCDAPLRVGRGGKACKPYHEVQAALEGDAARSLLDMFIERWADAKGETLDAASLMGPASAPLPLPEATFEMPHAEVGIYRELPHRLGRPPVREVKDLLVSAIASAERFIYIETQYLTSQAIADALVERMRDPARSKLDIVVMLPHKPEALKEELAIGGTQSKVLAELTSVAKETGHAMGVFNVAVRRQHEDVFVYIHSKLMIVDDLVLTIGSANLNNRSMSLDSEVNVAWSAREQGDEVARAIAGLRARLLTEHIGRSVDPRVLAGEGLVGRLTAIATNEHSRLREHDLTVVEPSALLEAAQKVASAYADPLHAPESEGVSG
jgi:phospholipase D1/2